MNKIEYIIIGLYALIWIVAIVAVLATYNILKGDEEDGMDNQ